MPGSVRALRKIYGRLHTEGHVNNKAAILVRAGEKLASENKILRQENEGLRGAIFEEKRKRKRGKTLDFYKGEQTGEALFFCPAKVARARERAAALEEAELQRQRTAADKKLQQAIAREKKGTRDNRKEN
jgi:hypothetical protein